MIEYPVNFLDEMVFKVSWRKKLKYIGLLNPSNDLVLASECNSQIEGSPYDGPCLWSDMEEALEAFEGNFPDGYTLVEVELDFRQPGIHRKNFSK